MILIILFLFRNSDYKLNVCMLRIFYFFLMQFLLDKKKTTLSLYKKKKIVQTKPLILNIIYNRFTIKDKCIL